MAHTQGRRNTREVNVSSAHEAPIAVDFHVADATSLPLSSGSGVSDGGPLGGSTRGVLPQRTPIPENCPQLLSIQVSSGGRSPWIRSETDDAPIVVKLRFGGVVILSAQEARQRASSPNLASPKPRMTT